MILPESDLSFFYQTCPRKERVKLRAKYGYFYFVFVKHEFFFACEVIGSRAPFTFQMVKYTS